MLSLVGPGSENYFLLPESLQKSESVASSHKLEDRAGHRRFRQDGKFKSSMSYKIRLLKKPKSNEIKLHANESLSSVFYSHCLAEVARHHAGLIPLLGPAPAYQTGMSKRAPLSADKGPRELGSPPPPLVTRLSPHIPAYRNKTL